MAVYYTIRCPHCNGIVESGKNRSSKYGSPLRTCRNCGKPYIDDNFVEVAFLSEKEIKNRSFSWQSIVWALVGILVLFFGISESSVIMTIIGIILAGIGAVSIISYLRYVPKNDKSLQLELEQSKNRLSNPNYVIALMQAGYMPPRELVEWAKEETGYKEKRDIIKEKMMDDENYDKSRYICKSFKFLEESVKGKCMMCLHTDNLKKYKIKNEIGTREISICDKCVNRFKEHNPNI